MNLYSPYYDRDEERTVMSIDSGGSWVHINTLRSLLQPVLDARGELGNAVSYDCENGAPWLSAMAAKEFATKYPSVSKCITDVCEAIDKLEDTVPTNPDEISSKPVLATRCKDCGAYGNTHFDDCGD